MPNIIRTRSTHAGKLERWLGKEQVENISTSMRGWYGKRPILVGGVPGAGGVWCGAGGDFVGRIDGGDFVGLAERCVERLDHAVARIASRHTMSMGFSSLSDLINEVSNNGKRRDFTLNKTGTATVVGGTNSLWRVGAYPAAANAASNAPTGNVPTSSTQGAFFFVNPTSPDTQHFVRADVMSSAAPRTLLMYDRLFEVNKTMSSAAAENVTGTPTRYQNVADDQPDSRDGNFLCVEIQAALGATAHNWTATYTDHNGNAGTLPSLTGNASGIINRLDHPLNQWFAPLQAGDNGIGTLTQMTCSAVVTGTVAFFIGHPIAFLPCVVANMITIVDGINTAFNLTRVFDNAALSFLDLNCPATTAPTFNGMFATASG